MRRYLYLIFSAVAMVLISASATAQTKVIQGNSKYGEFLYNFDGQNLRAGRSEYSEVIFNWDGQRVVEDIIRVIHLICPEGSLEASFVKHGIVSHQR